jgi:HAD superfamily hydrolase (TIGR01549 family)
LTSEDLTRIRAVLFDAYGTLWIFSPGRPLCQIWTEIIQTLGHTRSLEEISAADRVAREHFAPTFQGLETSGSPTSEADIDSLWQQYDFMVLGELAIQIDVESMHKVVLPAFWSATAFPETVGVLKALKERGYKLAIVSNGCYQDRAARRLGIKGYFDTIVGSWHVGRRKPEREIFDIALTQLGLTAGEAVMVGDRWDLDVVGGTNAGLHVLHLCRDTDDAERYPASLRDLWGVVEFVDRDPRG